MIDALVTNSLTPCGIVNGNIYYDIFNTWLEKIVFPELLENSIIIIKIAWV